MKRKLLFLALSLVFITTLLCVVCSADEVTPPPPPPDGYVPPYGDAVSAFTALLDARANNLAYAYFIDYYRGFGDRRFFEIDTFFSGTMDFANNTEYTIYMPIGVYSDSSAIITKTMNIDNAVIAVFDTDNDVPQYIALDPSGYITFALYFNDSICRLEYTYYADNSVVPIISMVFNGTRENGSLKLILDSFNIDGNYYIPADIYKVEIAFAVSNTDNVQLLSDFAHVFYSVAPYFYSDKVYSPSNFYQGFKKSYNLGYADGERWAYGYGYEAGYTDGYSEGYDEGYEVGFSDGVRSSDSYQLGYNDAVSDIDSGDFGRNLLGNMFSAPFEALGQFKIASYTNVLNGNTEYVTLGMVISAAVGIVLFWWFLKMFSGG